MSLCFQVRFWPDAGILLLILYFRMDTAGVFSCSIIQSEGENKMCFHTCRPFVCISNRESVCQRERECVCVRLIKLF